MPKIIQRELFNEVKKHLLEKEATVVIGPRQSGKTTLLLLLKDGLKEQGVPADNILYFNLDRFSDLEFFVSQEEAIKFLERRKGAGKIYFFIDEAQRIKEAGRFLKGIYDTGLPVKFILTGSSSLEIKSVLAEPLTGRKRIFYLFPFSFSEFLGARAPSLKNASLATADISSYELKKIFGFLEEFLVFGGYPRVALEENPAEKIQLLGEIYQSYLEKDIVSFLKIKKPLLFKKLAGLLAAQAGQLVQINELALHLNIERKTVENHIGILEETFVIKRIAPFFRNPRKELVKMPKIFFMDNGLRNFALNNFAPFPDRADKGALLENFVASEIIKSSDPGTELHYWRTQHGAEVDFILQQGERMFPIEVKTRFARAVLPGPLRSFLNDYPEATGALLVNMNIAAKKTLGNKQINFIYPHMLPYYVSW